jgi:hypothetical protein
MEQRERDDENARTWRERLARWKKSGLSGREFADQEGVGASTVYYWSRRLDVAGPRGRMRPSSMRTHPRVLPVVVTSEKPQPASVSVLEVVLPGGEMVRVPPGFDEAALARVVRVLGGGR